MDMDRGAINYKTLLAAFKKWKIPILLAVIGFAVLLFPKNQEPQMIAKENPNPTPAVEEKIEKILSEVDGAGAVHVMLTLKNDGQTEYQTDEELFCDEDSQEQRTKTVFHGDEPLIRSRSLPEYLGAVVVCQGGDDPKVCLKLIDALCSLTGLTSNKITVLKMN